MSTTNYLGISLGTCNTYIASRAKGIAVSEASAVAYDTYDTNEIVALGHKAKRMRGRAPETITVSFPINKGVIADFRKTVVMLKAYIDRVKKNKWGLEIMVAVPPCATAVEQRAVSDAVTEAYGSKVILVEEPIAAALGCDLDIFDSGGQMIVDIGAGNTEISVLSQGEVVFTRETECSASTFDRDIAKYLSKSNRMLIGDETAEQIKIRLGSVVSEDMIDFMTVSGRDLVQGLPVEAVISTDDVRESIQGSINNIIDGILYALEHIEPQLSSDIIKNKIHLVGGGALLKGWEELILKNTGITAVVAENPMGCVALGAGKARGLMRKIKSKYWEQGGKL